MYLFSATCKYRDKSCITKNQTLWTTFLLQTVWIISFAFRESTHKTVVHSGMVAPSVGHRTCNLRSWARVLPQLPRNNNAECSCLVWRIHASTEYLVLKVNWMKFLSYSVRPTIVVTTAITVTGCFSATIIVTVKWCLFLSFYWISVTVTINWNHTASAPLCSGLIRQAAYTCVPVSPSSITWYQSKGGDALRLERWP